MADLNSYSINLELLLLSHLLRKMAETALHNVILRIPHSLAGHILTTWLNVKELCKLDSAFCNSELREPFQTLLSSGQVVYPNIPEPVHLLTTIPFLMAWLNAKKILMYTLELTPQSLTTSFEAYVQLIAKNLRHMSLHNFKQGLKSMLTMFEANDFANLRSLQCSFSDLERTLKNHLNKMQSTLKEVRFKRCTNFGVDVFTGICLPKVTIMSVVACKVDKPFVTTMSECCGNIEYLNLSDCGVITDQDVTALARNCPNLRLVSIAKQTTLTDAAIVELSERCAKLMVLDVVGCTALTDRSITALATNCRLLESLYLRDNSNFTDAAMQALCDHACTTLEVLDVVNCPGITLASVGNLLAASAKMMILYIGNGDGRAVHTETSMCSLLARCGKLEKLSLECTAVSTEVLAALAAHCGALVKLGLHRCTRGITVEGLYAVATQCAGLELLVLPEECSVVNDFSVMLWKVIRPKLTITTDDDRIVCKIETQLDYFA